jgi:hypothetical protein
MRKCNPKNGKTCYCIRAIRQMCFASGFDVGHAGDIEVKTKPEWTPILLPHVFRGNPLRRGWTKLRKGRKLRSPE